ncbi:MAG: FHA domain-containing protein [Abditibacteriota bacterium]|nr:FHA domain-containing protein [Abditibacteriota bacterium]
MEKYKICPDCGARNDVERRTCPECGASLMNVAATDDETEERVKQQQEPPREATVSDEPSLVRLCDCGHRNPAAARKCEKCGAPLTSADISSAAGRKCALLLADGTRFPITGKTVIGRSFALGDRLSGINTVSRRHGEAEPAPEGLYVRDLDSANGTWTGGKRIDGKGMLLHDGAVLVLAYNPADKSEPQKTAFYITVEVR